MSAHPGRARGPALAGLLALVVACSAAPRVDLPASERAEYARLHLERARTLRAGGDLEAAERTVRRVLEVEPSSRAAQLLHAELLEALGRGEQARRARATSDLDGSVGTFPNAAVDLPSRDVLVVVSGAELDQGLTLAYVSAMTDAFASVLAARVAQRLPEARLVRQVPGSVDEARDWLQTWTPRAVVGLRGARAFCGDSVKDGRFAVAELEVTAGRPDDAELRSFRIRETLEAPPSGSRCVREVAARAFERALAHPTLRAALRAEPVVTPRWSAGALRQLFAGLDAAIEARLEAGRQAMARGHLDAALEAFREAQRMDPGDARAQAYRSEAETTLALRRELRAGGTFVSEAAREAQLATRQLQPSADALAVSAGPPNPLRSLIEGHGERHDELLALVERRIGPAATGRSDEAAEAVAAERDPVGMRLASARGDGPVRAFRSGDGRGVAYFAEPGRTPVLAAQDTDGDGRPDRWLGYRAGRVHELWEDDDGDGAPDVHVVFAPGGNALERIEIDGDADGRPERVLAYTGGRLVSVAWDSDGDGVLDRYERYDAIAPSGPAGDDGRIGGRARPGPARTALGRPSA